MDCWVLLVKLGLLVCGGLGHMATRLAHAIGAHEGLFTTSPEKKSQLRSAWENEAFCKRNKANKFR